MHTRIGVASRFYQRKSSSELIVGQPHRLSYAPYVVLHTIFFNRLSHCFFPLHGLSGFSSLRLFFCGRTSMLKVSDPAFDVAVDEDFSVHPIFFNRVFHDFTHPTISLSPPPPSCRPPLPTAEITPLLLPSKDLCYGPLRLPFI